MNQEDLTAMRHRYGKGMMSGIKIMDKDQRMNIMNSMRDVPRLLDAVQRMVPEANELGRLSLTNELLKEQLFHYEKIVKELQEQIMYMSYSGA